MKTISFRNDILPMKDTLYRLALRITLNPAEAEDIVQDTLIKVWNRRESWGDIKSIEAFGMTICRNLSLDHVRRHENHNSSMDSIGTDAPDNSSSPAEDAEYREKVVIIKSIVDSLPEKQRSCMQLRDFEGYAYKDIAAVLGMTEEQVKVTIFRARQTVKRKVKEIDDYGL